MDVPVQLCSNILLLGYILGHKTVLRSAVNLMKVGINGNPAGVR